MWQRTDSHGREPGPEGTTTMRSRSQTGKRGRGACAHTRSSMGYTLVEVLTAAAILAVVIFAIIAVVRKGRELQVSDNHRRQARAIIRAKLEKEFYYRDYNLIAAGTTTEVETLAVRDGGPVTATLTTTVSDSDTLNAANSTPIPTKQVTVKAVWNETGAEAGTTVADSIVITKWLAKATTN